MKTWVRLDYAENLSPTPEELSDKYPGLDLKVNPWRRNVGRIISVSDFPESLPMRGIFTASFEASYKTRAREVQFKFNGIDSLLEASDFPLEPEYVGTKEYKMIRTEIKAEPQSEANVKFKPLESILKGQGYSVTYRIKSSRASFHEKKDCYVCISRNYPEVKSAFVSKEGLLEFLETLHSFKDLEIKSVRVEFRANFPIEKAIVQEPKAETSRKKPRRRYYKTFAGHWRYERILTY